MFGRKSAQWVIIIFLFVLRAAAEEEIFKWTSISGMWRINLENNNSFLVETKIKARAWGYSELINYNSLITTVPMEKMTSVKVLVRYKSLFQSPVEMMVFFSTGNYREFFAFRFRGNESKLDTVQFISSKIKDASKPPSEKWNYVIAELEKGKCDIEVNKDYLIEIAVSGQKAVLYIDGEKALEGKADRDLGSGKIGFSGRNAALRIDDVNIFSNKEIIFQDDFSKDTVRRIEVRGKLEKVK